MSLSSSQITPAHYPPTLFTTFTFSPSLRPISNVPYVQSVRTFNAPPLFFFHTANAYEEGGQLHVDIACSSAQSPKDMFNLIKDLRIQDILSLDPGKEISRCGLGSLGN
jgi:hypothetical protein